MAPERPCSALPTSTLTQAYSGCRIYKPLTEGMVEVSFLVADRLHNSHYGLLPVKGPKGQLCPTQF
jgi:hypothetical protein